MLHIFLDGARLIYLLVLISVCFAHLINMWLHTSCIIVYSKYDYFSVQNRPRQWADDTPREYTVIFTNTNNFIEDICDYVIAKPCIVITSVMVPFKSKDKICIPTKCWCKLHFPLMVCIKLILWTWNLNKKETSNILYWSYQEQLKTK